MGRTSRPGPHGFQRYPSVGLDTRSATSSRNAQAATIILAARLASPSRSGAAAGLRLAVPVARASAGGMRSLIWSLGVIISELYTTFRMLSITLGQYLRYTDLNLGSLLSLLSRRLFAVVFRQLGSMPAVDQRVPDRRARRFLPSPYGLPMCRSRDQLVPKCLVRGWRPLPA